MSRPPYPASIVFLTTLLSFVPKLIENKLLFQVSLNLLVDFPDLMGESLLLYCSILLQNNLLVDLICGAMSNYLLLQKEKINNLIPQRFMAYIHYQDRWTREKLFIHSFM